MNSRRRLLGTAGTKGCKFSCVYCFTRDPEFVRCPLLDSMQPSEYIKESLPFEVIQPSCDTELFLMPGWQDYLDDLASAGKIISFATKAVLDESGIQFLKQTHELLVACDAMLHICVTIVRIRGWEEIEPHAPSPDERIRFLRSLWEAGISTCVAIRPLLPFLEKDELDEIVAKTHRFAYGYISGPLYVTGSFKKWMAKKAIDYPVTKRRADWLSGAPEIDVLENPELETHLKDLIQGVGREYFESNIAAACHEYQNLKGHPRREPDWRLEIRREQVATLYIVDPKTRKFLLMFHRNLGGWLPPGGHVEYGETLVEAALREADEEVGVLPEIIELKGTIDDSGKAFRCVDTADDSPAFCTIEEFIQSLDGQDSHIHVDAIIVGIADSTTQVHKKDPSEVTSKDWFSIEDIRSNIKTFDNVPVLCEAILNAMDEQC